MAMNVREEAKSNIRIFLFAVEARSRQNRAWSTEDSLTELSLLAKTAGLVEAGRGSQKRDTPHPKTYMGAGKLREVIDHMKGVRASTLVVDDELSPAQHRYIEEQLPVGFDIIDRTVLILGIFADHARTRQGKLQVEMARCRYILPRLSGLWTHLERQSGTGTGGVTGGVGLRGPGETQIEADRRGLRRRISKLKKELERIRAHRRLYRTRREQAGFPVVALTGYTNAGKSTLLNMISGADVQVDDQLFATLDPATRRASLPSGRIVLLTDTVGFVNKLPPDLVAAFRATLEDIGAADLILHIVDITHPKADAQMAAVEKILQELGVAAIPTLTVWNKIDACPYPLESEDHTFQISARTGEGVDRLLARVEASLAEPLETMEVALPYSEARLLDTVRRLATVEREEPGSGGIFLRVRVPPRVAFKLRRYRL
jgi:GTP-binding protein HflX